MASDVIVRDEHGTGRREHRLYRMPPHPDYWPAVTDVPCPVDGCVQTVVWYEAGYVPGWRVCMASIDVEAGTYDHDSIQHVFRAAGDAAAPTMIRHDCCEETR